MVLEQTLESPLDCKEIKPANPKGNNPECTLEGLMLKLKFQYFGHLMQRADSLEKTLMLGKIEGRRRRGQQRMRWLDGITGLMDMSKLWEIVKNREAWHAAIHEGRKESDVTEQLNNNSLPGCGSSTILREYMFPSRTHLIHDPTPQGHPVHQP